MHGSCHLHVPALCTSVVPCSHCRHGPGNPQLGRKQALRVIYTHCTEPRVRIFGTCHILSHTSGFCAAAHSKRAAGCAALLLSSSRCRHDTRKLKAGFTSGYPDRSRTLPACGCDLSQIASMLWCCPRAYRMLPSESPNQGLAAGRSLMAIALCFSENGIKVWRAQWMKEWGRGGPVQESISESPLGSTMIPLIHGPRRGSMESYRMTGWEGSFGKLMDLSCPLWKSRGWGCGASYEGF